MIVKQQLEVLNVKYNYIELGEVELVDSLTKSERNAFGTALLKYGLELMEDKKAVMVDKIKKVIVEMIHYADNLPKQSHSEYISEKLNFNYQKLALLFMESTGITVERYIISQKIEKAKELLLYEDMSLVEIAFKLNYSSVSHLCTQFKRETGVTPQFFKGMKMKKSNRP
jgi:AraC-like DNA-binding protein